MVTLIKLPLPYNLTNSQLRQYLPTNFALVAKDVFPNHDASALVVSK